MKMNLVEACRLAKNIENFKRSLSYMLMDNNYTVRIKENHLKSKAATDISDEVIDVEVKKDYDVEVVDIIAILEELMEKKAILSSAIEDAKHNITIEINGCKLSYDSAVEYNKSLRDVVISSVHRLNATKDGLTKTSARDYKFDNEGKQTPYIYQVETTTTLTFDKKDTKKKERSYRKLADEVSTKIDEAKMNASIELDLGIELNDTLEDIIDAYLESKEVEVDE